jgi:ACT domain-containing protein
MDIKLTGTGRSVVQGILFSSLLLGGCSAAAPNAAQEQSGAVQDVQAPMSSPGELQQLSEPYQNKIAAKNIANATDSSISTSQKVPIPQQKTQLIKKASLGLRVQDVEKAIQGVSKAISTHGGDILGLQDQVPQEKTAHQQATVQIRVPQDQLDVTLADLSKLGTVENRSIQAEDVATQLVDFESRLKNLRKSEDVVLRIMDRSGSVGDVLKVSQQLSQIRNEIEQIQGQVQHLKQQVAFSTISLTLKEAIAQNQKGIPVGDRLQESWFQSTHAMGETTIRFVRWGVWLLVFSPYIVGGIGLIVLGRKLFVRRSGSIPLPSSSPEQ